MPRITKDDWKAWSEERERFAKRETQGFAGDIKTLEQHIKTLREVCPKEGSAKIMTSNKTEAEQEQEIIDIIMDILKNKAWTLREDGRMILDELKAKGYIRLK